MKTLLISLTSFFLCACGNNFPTFPEVEYVYEIDVFNKVCARYKVINQDPLKVSHEADLPLNECEGFSALPLKNVQDIFFWKAEVKDWVGKHCGGK